MQLWKGPPKKHLGLMLVMASCSIASAASTQQRIDDIKVSMIYQFAKYTHWPESATTNISFCTLGDDNFHYKMRKVIGKQIDGKNATAKHLDNVDDVNNNQCHVIYISPALANDLPYILAKLADKPILTISELEDFTLKGGMINFVRKGQRQRFEISRRATQKTGLSMSSKLLQVAKLTD